jgi:hypothetical protein
LVHTLGHALDDSEQLASRLLRDFFDAPGVEATFRLAAQFLDALALQMFDAFQRAAAKLFHVGWIDVAHRFLGGAQHEIQARCEILRGTPLLAGGLPVLGLSAGGFVPGTVSLLAHGRQNAHVLSEAQGLGLGFLAVRL